jgi:hypothetical protein
MIEPVIKADVERAIAAEKKAVESGDANDYVAAETAYYDASRAAYAAMSTVEQLSPKWHRLAGFAKSLGETAAVMKQASREVASASYRAKKDKWSRRDMMVAGSPPATINVLDQHGGFTAVTKPGYGGSLFHGNTLWRGSGVLKGFTTGTLQTYDPKSFFQGNNDVTIAIYKVRGYRYPIAVWFDNKTGARIA